jgi:hypothetical protein
MLKLWKREPLASVVCRTTPEEGFVDLQSIELNFDKVASWGLHEEDTVASWYWNRLTVSTNTEGNHRVSIWPVTQPAGYIQTSSQ